MRELHRMNALRIGWIAARVPAGARGASILDMGCGGGIAAEALARAGFAVTGADASPDAIGVARAHAAAAGLDIDYRIGLARDLADQGLRFDAIAALEIIEHVPDQAAFVATLAGMLAPGGTLFVSTLNRTWRSLAVAKIGAEYVARLLPAGTHDWRAFVRPDELAAMGRAAGLRMADVSGMTFRPGTGWVASRDTAINYITALTSG
jgi:2-polyprenyl-6-hydroxyphenyl methylase/3-demethylubiquinone-9 3-methyltransferase